MSIVDLLVILAVVALLCLAATKDFSHYDGRTVASPPTATAEPKT